MCEGLGRWLRPLRTPAALPKGIGSIPSKPWQVASVFNSSPGILTLYTDIHADKTSHCVQCVQAVYAAFPLALSYLTVRLIVQNQGF